MDLAQIRRVAELAELSLTEDEEKRLAGEMSRILAYVAELEAVDTANVPPTTQLAAGGEEAWRADEIAPGLSHDEALRGAPRAEHDGFAVPTFVE